MKYKDLATTIIAHVGGEQNIKSLTHCLTRLRFRLKDETLVNRDGLVAEAGVLQVIQNGGQHQVVIGNHVEDVYKAVLAFSTLSTSGDEATATNIAAEKESWSTKMFDLINAVFASTLGVLAASGLIKGMTSLLFVSNLITKDGGTYQVLMALGDAFFYFFPIFLGKNTMKKFGGNETLGMVLGAFLVYPTLIASMEGTAIFTLFSGSVLESPIYLRFLGIPVIMMNYSTSVIPIIAACAIAAPLEKWLRAHLHDAVKNTLAPFFTLVIVGPLTLMVVGVLATWIGMLIGEIVLKLYNLSPPIAGLLLGSVWQLLVISGLQWGVTPLVYLNYSTLGYDPVFVLASAASFAQTGAVLGVLLKTRDKKLKTTASSAFLTGVFGITEPAIYGVTLTRMKIFIYSCIGAAIGGSILGIFGSANYVQGGIGFFGLTTKINPAGIGWDFYGALVGVGTAFLIGFLLTLLATKQTDIDQT